MSAIGNFWWPRYRHHSMYPNARAHVHRYRENQYTNRMEGVRWCESCYFYIQGDTVTGQKTWDPGGCILRASHRPCTDKKRKAQRGESEKKVKLLCRVRLFATPRTVAYQAPPSMRFSRQGYWSGLPFPSPGDLPNPGEASA